jgi:hypothetical protein
MGFAHGSLRWSLGADVVSSDQREAPRAKAVASSCFVCPLFSDQRESPQDKPVASA